MIDAVELTRDLIRRPSVTPADAGWDEASMLAFLASVHVWWFFDPQTPGLQFTEAYEWIPAFGIEYYLGIDGMSLMLILLTGFLGIPGSLPGDNYLLPSIAARRLG